MNTLNILISYEYVSSLVLLNWYDILFAVEEGFLLPEAAIKHAILELENNENPKESVINLAYLENGESIYPYIYELGASSEQYKKESEEKFLYVVLNWIYEHKEIYYDQLEAVEIVYADFNYPEIISNFVRYMPCDYPILGTLEACNEQIFENWKNFLEHQKSKYKKC